MGKNLRHKGDEMPKEKRTPIVYSAEGTSG